jgi:hypothetical protein
VPRWSIAGGCWAGFACSVSGGRCDWPQASDASAARTKNGWRCATPAFAKGRPLDVGCAKSVTPATPSSPTHVGSFRNQSGRARQNARKPPREGVTPEINP